MSSKIKKRYSFLRKTEWWINGKALAGFIAFLGVCPLSFLPSLSRVLGRIGYYLGRSRRIIALSNMERALGSETTEVKRKSLVKKVFTNITLDLIEVLRCYYHPAQIEKMNITVHGREHLDAALSKGHGVVAVTAHLGNFPMIAAYLANQGYPLWLIFKPPNSPGAANVFSNWMKRVGIRVVTYKPRRVCAVESLRVLKNNGIVTILVDQNASRRLSTYVEFFGQWVPMFSGPVVMARRSGAAVIPMYMHRQDDGHLVLTILPELTLSSDKGKDGIAEDLRSINRLYEQWIRAYPSQWWWVHRRFRHARKTMPADGQIDSVANTQQGIRAQ
jgi:KDO2-lipid IV(A) lauroyltransferase